MPAPLTALIMRSLGETAGGIIRGVAVSSLTLPLTRAGAYTANQSYPNVTPDLDEVVKLYYKGVVDYSSMQLAAALTGVQIGDIDSTIGRPAWWRDVVEQNKPQLPLDIARRALALGRVDGNKVDDIIRRLGYADRSDRGLIRLDCDPLDLATILSLWWRKDIDDETLQRLLWHAGYPLDAIQGMIKQSRVGPAMGDIVRASLAGRINEQQARDYMRWMGVIGEPEQNLAFTLGKQIPGPGDLIQFLVKEAFDQDVITAFGYDDEYPAEFNQFMRAQGYDWSPSEIAPGLRGAAASNWPIMYWRAHWQVLSPGQAYEMLHRLRPTGGINGGPRVPGVQPFTIADVNRVLKVADYPRAFRDRLAALSYRVLTRIDTRRLYRVGIISKDEVREQYQDQGYTQTDAQRLADFTERELQQTQLDRLKLLTLSQVEEAYKLGSMSRQDTLINLHILYAHDVKYVREYLDLPRERQIILAQQNPWVVNKIGLIDNELNTQLLKAALAAVRKSYLRLELTDDHARDFLVNQGITYDRASTYISNWKLLLIGRGAEPSASQISAWFRRGLINRAVAAVRLARLGYTNYDITLMLAMAQTDMAREQTRELEKAATIRKQQQREMLAQKKAVQQQLDRLQALLAKSATAAQILKWVPKGIVSIRDAFLRLRVLGKTTADAIRFMREVATDAQKPQITAVEREVQAGKLGTAADVPSGIAANLTLQSDTGKPAQAVLPGRVMPVPTVRPIEPTKPV